MQFYIDIEDSSGNRFGSGPITDATMWRSTQRVDKAGDFSFSMPLADPKSALVAKRRYAKCYAILDDGPTLIGSGIIDKIDTKPDDRGDITLTVSGDDLMRELAWRSVEYLQLRSGTSPVTHAVAAASLSLEAPGGWTVTADPSPPNDDVYFLFQGETVLAAAIKVAELSRNHVWMDSARSLTFTSTFTDSGLRAIEAPINPDLSNENTCFIEAFTVTEDTFDLISRILPWGAEIPGLTGNYTSLFNATKTAPAGYTLSTANKYIRADDTEATYGQVEAFVKYNDIKAASSNVNDIQSAANQLFDIALRDLQQRSQPAQYYTLSLAYAAGIIEPMQTIRCIFRRVSHDRNILTIDQDLYILGSTIQVDVEGLRTIGLDVATIDRWPPADTDATVRAAREQLLIA